MQIVSPLFWLIVVCLLQLMLLIAAVNKAEENRCKGVEVLPLHSVEAAAPAGLRGTPALFHAETR
jgi:hypothetical protein